MDVLLQTTTALWMQLRPIASSAVALTIAILTIILLICIGSNLAREERDGMQEGLVGGVWEAVGSEYPKSQLPTGLLGVQTMMLYADPGAVGEPLNSPPPTPLLSSLPCSPGTRTSSSRTISLGPMIENVPFDPRWVTARAGWVYGPLTGLNSAGLPMTSSDSGSGSGSGSDSGSDSGSGSGAAYAAA